MMPLRKMRTAVIALAAFGLFIFLCLAVFPSRQNWLMNIESGSRAVYDGNGRLLRLSLSSDEKYRLWVPLKEISRNLVEATILQEDKYFYYHPGVNPVSLLRAAWQTFILKTRRVGASTITMQLARLRFGINSQNIVGKISQILKAAELERIYSKDEILEAYLNTAPYGGNIEGVEAASLVYFEKHSSQLSLPEALALAVLPQDPVQRSASLRAPYKNPEITAARGRLFRTWLSRYPEASDSNSSFELPLTASYRSELPFKAPHFVDHVLSLGPPIHTRTGLNLELQNLLEGHVKAAVEKGRERGIENAVAMLVHYPSMEVRAMVGSADYWSNEIDGQVDGTRGKRSPGSAVKPFVYALGLDRGLIHASSVLKDIQVSYAAYNPENFDGDFTGPINATEALIRSRNLPAIQLTNMLPPPGLYGFLKQAGVRGLKKENFYGLALALGGFEVTMEELVSLYAMLANEGVLKPLVFIPSEQQPFGEVRLLSKEASFITLEMLRENPEPTQEVLGEFTRSNPDIAWKTGTSYGFRDAWSVGIFGEYVLAVWVGNFSGRGNPAFVGREVAAPLFFDIMRAVRSTANFKERRRFIGSLNVKKVKVCPVSGKLPGPYCRHTVESWYIPGVSPISTCDVHREIAIDVQTGLRACSNKDPDVKLEVAEFWPTDILDLFRQAGLPRKAPPPFKPDCGIVRQVAPLEIVSPQKGITYTIRSARLSQEQIPFSAVTDSGSHRLYWFIGEQFLGSTSPERALSWKPRPGKFVVRAVDDQGRAGNRMLKVELVD